MGKLAEAVKAAPPISVTGLKFAGIQLSEWVLILTAAYTVLLIIHKGVEIMRVVRGRPPPVCGRHDCQWRHRRSDDPQG